MFRYRKFFYGLLVLFYILVVFVIFSNVWVIGSTRNQVVELSYLAEEPRTALLLGTSYNTANGERNSFFEERISTAVSIYKSGLTDRIILSGSKTKYYNEPSAMRSGLVELGVPENILLADDGGMRTLDSVVRCKEVFKEDKILIITQRFHAYRALFISNYYKMNAVVVINENMNSSNLTGVLFREFFARPLAVIDLYILHRKPQFANAAIN